MKKRVFSLLIVLCLVLGMLPAVSAMEVASGTCGENLTWILTEDGTLTISGTGKMKNYSSAANKPAPWFAYSDSILQVVVDHGVTSIGNCAFEQLPLLAEVTLPQTLTEIGTYAFENCLCLTQIALPNALTRIGNNAFNGCSKLQEITLPSGITAIEDGTFKGCSALIRVELPDGLTDIGSSVFMDCGQLAEITLPASLRKLGLAAFASCRSLEQITIPEGITVLPTNLFGGCNALQKISLPDSLLTISSQAFWYNNKLADLIIPKNVVTIASSAFRECKAEYLIFTGSAPDIAADAFKQSKATVYYPADNSSWNDDKLQQYGGNLTWIGYEGEFHIHEYTATVTAPTCTEQGYTTYTCSCGDSYAADYVDALGHDYADGTCTRCGEADPNPQPARNPFTDVPAGAFYEAPVLWALENGITTGASENSFNPGGSCLRAQVVTFLHRTAGNPTPGNANNPFTDVKTSDFFYAPVLWAVEKGITNGIGATTFGSYDVCNRAAVVTFLWRAAGSPEPKTTDNPFTDVKSSDFFYKPVLWAIENGITNGVDATHFGPTSPCNRAQVVTFLYRACS